MVSWLEFMQGNKLIQETQPLAVGCFSFKEMGSHGEGEQRIGPAACRLPRQAVGVGYCSRKSSPPVMLIGVGRLQLQLPLSRPASGILKQAFAVELSRHYLGIRSAVSFCTQNVERERKVYRLASGPWLQTAHTRMFSLLLQGLSAWGLL